MRTESHDGCSNAWQSAASRCAYNAKYCAAVSLWLRSTGHQASDHTGPPTFTFTESVQRTHHKLDCLEFKANHLWMRVYWLSTISHWRFRPWPDDLIWTWPVFTRDISDVQVRTSYVKGFNFNDQPMSSYTQLASGGIVWGKGMGDFSGKGD